MSEGLKGFYGAAVSLSIVTLLARTIAFVTQMVIARLFGAGVETDAYFAAESVILLLSGLIMVGFGIAFIPLWMEHRIRQGKFEARTFADAFISLSSVISLALGVAMILGAPLIARIIAPGFSPEAVEITTGLLRVMALAITLVGFTAGCTGLLEAQQHFLVPAFSRIVYGLVVLGAAVTLSSRMGIMALAWGTGIAAIARLLVQWANARKLGGFHLTWRVNHAGVRRAVRLMLPILVALAGLEVTLLIDNVFASLLPVGALTGLAYANRVILLPVGIIALPLRTTILPTLSHQAARRRFDELAKRP